MNQRFVLECVLCFLIGFCLHSLLKRGFCDNIIEGGPAPPPRESYAKAKCSNTLDDENYLECWMLRNSAKNEDCDDDCFNNILEHEKQRGGLCNQEVNGLCGQRSDDVNAWNNIFGDGEAGSKESQNIVTGTCTRGFPQKDKDGKTVGDLQIPCGDPTGSDPWTFKDLCRNKYNVHGARQGSCLDFLGN